MGPTVYNPYPKRLKSNHLRRQLQRQNFLLSYCKTLRVGLARVELTTFHTTASADGLVKKAVAVWQRRTLPNSWNSLTLPNTYSTGDYRWVSLNRVLFDFILVSLFSRLEFIIIFLCLVSSLSVFFLLPDLPTQILRWATFFASCLHLSANNFLARNKFLHRTDEDSANIAAFDLIWKWMRQMSVSIKFFTGSQVSSTKKWMKKVDSMSYVQTKCKKLWTISSQ